MKQCVALGWYCWHSLHLCSVEVLQGEVPQLTGRVQKEELESSRGDTGCLPRVTEKQHSNMVVYAHDSWTVLALCQFCVRVPSHEASLCEQLC